jgi:hypothetical protein
MDGANIMDATKAIKVRRLPVLVNFKDKYKTAFFLLLIFLVFAAASLLGKHGSGAICGGVAGLAVHWYMTMISEAHYCGRRSFGDIEDVIERAGYIKVTNERYRYRLPRFLRFDSQDIFISQTQDAVKVIGPAYMLSHLEKKLA